MLRVMVSIVVLFMLYPGRMIVGMLLRQGRIRRCKFGMRVRERLFLLFAIMRVRFTMWRGRRRRRLLLRQGLMGRCWCGRRLKGGLEYRIEVPGRPQVGTGEPFPGRPQGCAPTIYEARFPCLSRVREM